MAANEKYLTELESFGGEELTLVINSTSNTLSYANLQNAAYLMFGNDITSRVALTSFSNTDFWYKILPLLYRVVFLNAQINSDAHSLVLHKAGCFYSEFFSTPLGEGYYDCYSFTDPSEGGGQQGAVYAHFIGNGNHPRSGSGGSLSCLGVNNNVTFVYG